jgi:hypothetical protein
MDYNSPLRRRSPLWVRQMPGNSLHGLALRLMTESTRHDLSDGQEWLWSAVISELEWRNRQRAPLERCSCELCVQPFPDD